MRPRRVVGAVGAVATLIGALVFLRPTVATGTPVLGPVVRTLGSLGVRQLMLAGGGLVTLSLLAAALAPSDERVVAGGETAGAAFDRTVARPPESVVDDAPRTGEAFDATVDRAVAGDGAALERVRSRLTDVAAATLADSRANPDADGPDGSIAAGTWTDDRTAAAFLGGHDAPDPALRARLRAWLDPERERERRIARTIGAIERLEGES